MYIPTLKNSFKYLKLFLLQPSRVTTIPGLPYFVLILFSFLQANFRFNPATKEAEEIAQEAARKEGFD